MVSQSVRLSNGERVPSVNPMTPTTVLSASDPRLDPFRNMKGQGPRPDGTFVAESELVLQHIFESAIAVRALLIAPARAERLRDVLATYVERQATPIEVFVADRSVIDEVIGYPLHRGVIVLAERPTPLSATDVLKSAQTVVVLENVIDPDNVGTMFRHAAGFGVDAVLLHGPTGDPLYRKTLRTSMGWTLRIPYARTSLGSNVSELLAKAGFLSLALTPSPAADNLPDVLRFVDTDQKLALLLGAEGPGLTDETLQEADYRVRIPLSDGVDSLNVSTAGAIALYALSVAHPTRLAGRADRKRQSG